MNCKDCVHYELCKMYARFGVTDLPYNDETICDHFKNKANVIELPCKVGDYIEWDKGGGIGKTLYQVKGFLYYENSLRYVFDFFEPVVTHQAITGILTREEAEQRLKGGKQE